MTGSGRNLFRPPGRRTELEDGGQDGARFPDPRTEFIPDSDSVLQDGGRNLRTEDRTEADSQIPGRRTEPSSDSVLQDGGRRSRTEDRTEADSQIPGRNLFRPQIPSSRTEDGAGENPVLRPPGRNLFPAPSSRTEDGILKTAPSSRTTPGRSSYPPPGK